MLNKGDIKKSFRESFREVLSSMEEGVDYELTPDALEEINNERLSEGLLDTRVQFSRDKINFEFCFFNLRGASTMRFTGSEILRGKDCRS